MKFFLRVPSRFQKHPTFERASSNICVGPKKKDYPERIILKYRAVGQN